MLVLILKFLSYLGRFVGYLFGITLTIPLFVVVLVAGWVYLDRTSAIRYAVNNAVIKLVAGAELEAKDSMIRLKEQELKDVRDYMARQTARMQSTLSANRILVDNVQEATQNNKELKEKLDAISSNSCNDVIDKPFYDLMPKQQSKTSK